MKKFFAICFSLAMMTTISYAAEFIDIKGMDCEYAVERIEYLGIVNGTGEGKFEPKKTVTRAELSKMITEIVAKGNVDGNKSFSDVTGHWGERYINKAANLGILNGYSDGTFKPNNSVSYAEAIAIVMRCMGYTNLEQSTNKVWYESYISKMKEIGLNNGLDEFIPTTYANRGDISVILWNMLVSDSRINESKTMLKEYFPGVIYWENVKVNYLDVYAGNIMYVTSKGNFYVKEDIDFSDLGGLVSGFYDSKNHVLIGKNIDGETNCKKILGSMKSLSEAGYEILTCKNISGYGDKTYAEYVEIFVDEETNKVMRVVFYDTRNSHFAEKIKVGDTRVTIESRDVYDQSIVLLKNGQTITYNLLRNENVMDIDANSLLIHEGKVVNWENVPNASVIREIEKNKIYTYTNKYVEGKIENGKVNYRTMIMNNVEYNVSEECICQNTVSKETMKLSEGLTRDDIRKLSEMDNRVRAYLNEFNEIVKIEYTYEVWEFNKQVERENEYELMKLNMENIGFVSDTAIRGDGKDIRVTSLPKVRTKYYRKASSEFNVGDLVYLPSGETEVKKVTNKLKIGNVQVLMGYIYPINGNKMGQFVIGEDAQIVEVKLMKDENDNRYFSSCTMRNITLEEVSDYKKYDNIHLIVNEEGYIIRIYAIKEIGLSINLGTVKDIKEIRSGDELLETKVILYNDLRNTNMYDSIPVMGYSVGDLIAFNKIDKKDEESEPGIDVIEVYKHENIGSKYDLIVYRYNDRKITFRNSDLVMDLTKESFEYNGKTYYYDDYTFVNIEIARDKDTLESLFRYFTTTNDKTMFDLRLDDRIAIDEITGTIISYRHYKGE